MKKNDRINNFLFGFLFLIIILFINIHICGNQELNEIGQWILDKNYDDCIPPISKITNIIGNLKQSNHGVVFDGNQVQALLYGSGVNEELRINNDFTILIRAAFGQSIDRPLANHDTLVSRWGSLGNYSFLLRSDHYTKTLHLFLSSDGQEIIDYNSYYPIDRDGNFHNIVTVIHLGKSVAFYIDGREKCTLRYPLVPTTLYNPPGDILPFAIGYNSDPAPGGDYETMNGTIASVRLFQKALTSAEIAGLSGISLEQGKQKSCIVEVDANKSLGEVHPYLFGHFIENCQNTIYGGLYEEGSIHSDINGFRTDVLNAMKLLQPTIIRWPGGNYTSAYHWRWGAIPKKYRQTIYGDPVWGQIDPHTFGTPEFIEVSRRLGAEPYICVGVGRDQRCPTPEEAAGWVKYCNSRESPEAQLRAEAGYREPFNVMIWGLGNEVYGPWQIGFYQDPKLYAEDIAKYAKEMRSADPRIKFIICGDSYKPNFNIWNDTILTDEILKFADWISYHYYCHLGSFGPQVPYEAAMSRLLQVESDISELTNLIRENSKRAGREHPIKIAVDEWNEFGWGDMIDNARQEYYDLSHSIFTASFLNILIRHSNDVTMANYSPSVNCRGLIYANQQGVLLRSTYYVYKLYRDCVGGTVISVNVSGPVLDGSAAPALDITGVRLKEKTLILFVINRQKENSITCQFNINNFVVKKSEGKILTADKLNSYNDFNNPNAVTISDFPINADGDKFQLNFPAHSIVMLTLKSD